MFREPLFFLCLVFRVQFTHLLFVLKKLIIISNKSQLKTNVLSSKNSAILTILKKIYVMQYLLISAMSYDITYITNEIDIHFMGD